MTASTNPEISPMRGCNDIERCAPAADESEPLFEDEHPFDKRVTAVTAIDYRGRVLTVVSRSDAAGRASPAMGPVSFTTTILSGPLGQMTWTAETWINSLRNHETAVCQLIQSIASDCGV